MDFYKQFPHSNLNFDEAFEDLLSQFEKYEISTFQLLTTPTFELSQTYKLDNAQLSSFISFLKREESKKHEPKTPSFITDEFFTTGDSTLDAMLGGGLKTGELTEVFGESSTGKSQFVMQLSSSVQLPLDEGGLDGQCVLISTEGMVETKRLSEMNENGLDNIFVINCNDLETQEHIINVQLPTLLSQNPKIKLIIIDSISHHIRVELGSKFNDLKNYLNELGSRLSQISIEFSVSIVLTNQISDRPMKQVLNSDFRKINYDYQIGWLNGWDEQSIRERQDGIEVQGRTNRGIATLGLDWDKFINLKILLLKKYRYNEQFHRLEELKRSILKDGGGGSSSNGDHEEVIDDEKFWEVKRWFKVVYSSRCGDNEVEFKIKKKGIIAELNE